MWQPQEDNTYNDLRENSIRQWLEDMSICRSGSRCHKTHEPYGRGAAVPHYSPHCIG